MISSHSLYVPLLYFRTEMDAPFGNSLGVDADVHSFLDAAAAAAVSTLFSALLQCMRVSVDYVRTVNDLNSTPLNCTAADILL